MRHVSMFRGALLVAVAISFHARAQAEASPATQPNRFERDVAVFEKADRKSMPPRDANLFIGSSSFVKWKTLADDFPQAVVINRGFGGSEIADSTHFAGRIILPYHPKRIFLYAGDNDLAAGRTPQQALADFQTFVQTVRAGQPLVPIYFVSIKPSPARVKLLEKAREANRLIEDFTKEGKDLHFIDVFTPMLSADGQPRAELFGPDMLHMNASGYALWTKILAPLIRD